MKKQGNKGITLIALVITIIVLLILAGVSIAMLTGENGILSQAQRAKSETENAQANEESILDNYAQYIEGSTNGGTLTTVTGNETENTKVQDSLGNTVWVPAGFKVVNPGDNVEDGIVIEDVSHGATAGSQFVWIPVGKIKTTTGEKTITLGRYVFNEDGTINASLSKEEPTDQLKTYSDASYYYTEGLKDNSTANTHAKDINTFRTKVDSTGGYYVGRYEARTVTQRTASTNDSELTQITVEPNDYVYNYVTQIQAAKLSQEMYADVNFTSDLINSYAWDTAIDFLQKCDDREGEKNKPYSQQNSLNTGGLAEKGTNNLGTKDIICNIYDMASNCPEWTTETSSVSNPDRPCVSRGGDNTNNTGYTFSRYFISIDACGVNTSFRPILYL